VAPRIVRGGGLTAAALAGTLAAACGGTAPAAPPEAPMAGLATPTVSPSTTPTTGATATTTATTAARPPEPARLRIAAIGVDAAVVPVGVEADGDMEVPGAAEVGWYRFGPVPGAPGSAVLAAHVDFDGREGAFFRLRQLGAGAEVEVAARTGAVRRFRVTEVVRYPKDALPDDRVFGRGGGPRLTLVTCGGEFDTSARTYRDNVVAFAEPVA
jgi:hypothetical protein